MNKTLRENTLEIWSLLHHPYHAFETVGLSRVNPHMLSWHLCSLKEFI